MTGMRNFVRSREPTDVTHIVDHIEHVGVGSDIDMHGYYGMPPAVKAALRASYKSSMAFRERMDAGGFDHPQRMFDLVEALVRHGYADEEIEAVLGSNFYRLLGAGLGRPTAPDRSRVTASGPGRSAPVVERASQQGLRARQADRDDVGI